MMIQCCVCKKVQQEDTWKSAPEHYHDASHTYCPACAEDAREEIQAYRRAYLAFPVRRPALSSLQDLFQASKPMSRLGNDGSF